MEDEFAQTRPPDDLFDDDFTPIAEPVVEQAQSQEIPTVEPEAVSIPGSARGRSRNPRRGGGNTRQQEQPPPPTDADGKPAPAGPRHEAVRGDRSGTGGIRKAKLTEEELSERMEAIKLKNATIEAAHARAEADEANFRQMEAKAAAKAIQERQNRQQMMGEREKNRLRKLNALGGREWDAEKAEEDASDDKHDGRSRFRRGAHGGVASGRSNDDVQTEGDTLLEARDGPQGRGRGQGRRGGTARGRGRGGQQGPQNDRKGETSVPTADEFPALGAVKQSSGGAVDMLLSSESQARNGQSWADEMESPIVPPS